MLAEIAPAMLVIHPQKMKDELPGAHSTFMLYDQGRHGQPWAVGLTYPL
jgi:hypothetical protein